MDTQMHIRMFQPKTMRHCLLLGRLYERAHPKNISNPSWSGLKNNNHSQQAKGYNHYKKEGENKIGGQLVMPKKFLSQEEMSDRRTKRLCYHCDEKYTPDHYLKHKKIQLYSMDMNGDEDDVFEDASQNIDEEEDDIRPKVSVNAVLGVSDFRTMKIKGDHKKRTIFLLVDSGSTHNLLMSNWLGNWDVKLPYPD